MVNTHTSANEETFTLIRSFNDIFVTLASLLVVFPVCFLSYKYFPWLMFFGGSVLCWLLAEVFTRRRRMALPSIAFAFLCPAMFGYSFFATLIRFVPDTADVQVALDPNAVKMFEAIISIGIGSDWRYSICLIFGFLASTLVSWVFWKRFHVAISIAGCVITALAAVLTTVFAIDRYFAEAYLPGFFLVFGAVTLTYAIFWDQQDKARTGYQSDVAFWLHVFAAPMLVYAVMASVVDVGQALGLGAAIAVLGIFVLLTLVALLLDRRAILVASIAYVLAALNTLLSDVNIRVAFSLLILGLILLCLSIWWRVIRDTFIALLPSDLADRLPD